MSDMTIDPARPARAPRAGAAALWTRWAPSLAEWGEKAVFAALFVLLLAQIGPQLQTRPLSALFLAPNAFVTALVLVRRRARRLTLNPLDWTIALLASAAPLLLAGATGAPEGAGAVAGQGIMLLGMAFSLAATAALGRSFGVVPADRGVKRGGPYRLVRHPIYAGYALWQLGFVLTSPDARNLAAFALAQGLQVWRIAREERLLGADPDYQALQRQVRWRLIPFVY